jgi:hypothetical protein
MQTFSQIVSRVEANMIPSMAREWQRLLVSQPTIGQLIEFAGRLLLCKDDEKEPIDVEPDERSFKEFVMEFLTLRCPSLFGNALFQAQLEEDRLYGLLFGYVQSGKTDALLCTAMYSCLLKCRSAVIIVRDLTGDMRQLVGNISRTFGNESLWTRYLMAHNSFLTGRYLNVHYVGDWKTRGVQAQLVDALQPEKQTPHVIIALANKSQLSRLNQWVETLSESSSFDLIIDEVDEITGTEPTNARENHYYALRERAQNVLGVTATAFSVFFGDRALRSDGVFRLAPRPTYTGVKDFKWASLDTDVRFRRPQDEEGYVSVFDQDVELVDFMRAMSLKEPHDTKTRDNIKFRHPIIVLNNSSRFVHHHEEFIQSFSNRSMYRHEWVAISYDGNGIVMYHHSFQTRSIVIKGETPTPDNLYSGSQFLRFRSLEIGDVLAWLQNDDPFVQHYTHIVINAGVMAGRGINYCSNDYNLPGRWHITDMYFKPSPNGDSTQYIQCMRPCGNYNDHIRPTIYCTDPVKESILNAMEKQKRIMSGLESLETPDHVATVAYNTVVPRRLTQPRVLTKKVPKADLRTPGSEPRVIPVVDRPPVYESIQARQGRQQMIQRYERPTPMEDPSEEKEQPVEEETEIWLLDPTRLTRISQQCYILCEQWLRQHPEKDWIKRSVIDKSDLFPYDRRELTKMQQKCMKSFVEGDEGILIQKKGRCWYYKLRTLNREAPPSEPSQSSIDA